MQLVHDRVYEFLSTQSLPYRDGPIAFDGSEEAFLASHIQELRLCDTDFDATVPVGMRLMNWQVALASLPKTSHLAAMQTSCFGL